MYATLAEIYEYDNTIFDTDAMPADIDKNVLVTTILDECGENEVRYSNPAILKIIIDAFFRSNEYKYGELVKTMQYDYDPLVNYDLTITSTRKRKNSRNLTQSGESDGSTESKVSAYDTTSYSPERLTDSDGTYKSSEDETADGEETETRTESGDNSARSTQYMINEQRQIVDFNVYKIIAREIEDEITIPTWGRDGGRRY